MFKKISKIVVSKWLQNIIAKSTGQKPKEFFAYNNKLMI